MVKAWFKVPFGRQELSSSPSRGSSSTARSSPGSSSADATSACSSGARRSAASSTGESASSTATAWTASRNDNDDLQLNARVTWQPFGDAKYSEGDFESTDRPLLAIAAQYENNTLPIAAAGGVAAHARERTITGGDIVFKYRGLFLFGELFDATNDRTNNLVSFENSGFNVQAGYFVIPKRLELAARYAGSTDADRDNDERTETGLAVGYSSTSIRTSCRPTTARSRTRRASRSALRLQYQIMF